MDKGKHGSVYIVFSSGLNYFCDWLNLILTFRKYFISIAAKMNLLHGRRYSKLMYEQRCFRCSTGVSFVVTATLLLTLLIMMMCGTKLPAEDIWHSLSFYPTKNILGRKLWRYVAAQFSSLADLFSVIHRLKHKLASLISFVMMFSFTIYLLLLSLRKKGVRRCRVSSCLWTKRKVY